MLGQNNDIIFGIISVVLLLCLYYYVRTEQSFNEDFLFGSWDSDMSFNENAGIKQMKLFIGDSKGFITKTRDCYLHMDANDGNITSQVVKMKCSSSSLLPNINIQKYKINLEFEEEDNVIPDNLIMEVDSRNGLLKLYDNDDNLYGVLYKDNASSHLVKLEKEVGDADGDADNDDRE